MIFNGSNYPMLKRIDVIFTEFSTNPDCIYYGQTPVEIAESLLETDDVAISGTDIIIQGTNIYNNSATAPTVVLEYVQYFLNIYEPPPVEEW